MWLFEHGDILTQVCTWLVEQGCWLVCRCCARLMWLPFMFPVCCRANGGFGMVLLMRYKDLASLGLNLQYVWVCFELMLVCSHHLVANPAKIWFGYSWHWWWVILLVCETFMNIDEGWEYLYRLLVLMHSHWDACGQVNIMMCWGFLLG